MIESMGWGSRMVAYWKRVGGKGQMPSFEQVFYLAIKTDNTLDPTNSKQLMKALKDVLKSMAKLANLGALVVERPTDECTCSFDAQSCHCAMCPTMKNKPSICYECGREKA